MIGLETIKKKFKQIFRKSFYQEQAEKSNSSEIPDILLSYKYKSPRKKRVKKSVSDISIKEDRQEKPEQCLAFEDLLMLESGSDKERNQILKNNSQTDLFFKYQQRLKENKNNITNELDSIYNEDIN